MSGSATCTPSNFRVAFQDFAISGSELVRACAALKVHTVQAARMTALAVCALQSLAMLLPMLPSMQPPAPLPRAGPLTMVQHAVEPPPQLRQQPRRTPRPGEGPPRLRTHTVHKRTLEQARAAAARGNTTRALELARQALSGNTTRAL